MHAMAHPKRADGNGDEIDQEAVNDLIDYAIAHGVNYFDTSPPMCKVCRSAPQALP